MSDVLNKKLNKIVKEIESRSKKDKENEAYVRGKNPKLLNEKNKKSIDERIPIPLAKLLVTSLTGFLTRPGTVYIEYTGIEEGVDVPENVLKKYLEYDSINNLDIYINELLKDTLTYGSVYEIMYLSDELDTEGKRKPEFYYVQPGVCLPVYANNLKKPLMELWYLADGEETNDILTHFTKEEKIVYEKVKEQWVEKVKEPNIFNNLPVIEYKVDKYKDPVFEPQKNIIDGIDKAMSKGQNEVVRFSDALLAFASEVSPDLKNMLEKGEATILHKLFDDINGKSLIPEYVVKDLSGVSGMYKEQVERLVQFFFLTSQAINFSDDEFSGNASGVALRMKVLAIEFLASDIESYFSEGIKKRKSLYDGYLKQIMGINEDFENYKATMEFARNLPIDEENKVSVAAILKGLGATDEVLVRYLSPIVKTVEELRRITISDANL